MDAYEMVFGGPLGTIDSSIIQSAPCPVGTELWLTERDEKKIFAGADWLANDIASRAGGRKPIAVFHPDCENRGRANDPTCRSR